MKTVWLTGAAALLAMPLAAFANEKAGGEPITYTKHIAPLIQENCQECHRPESIAPFSLTSYAQVRGWSKMIREVVTDNRMPPWDADPAVGHFRNDRSLSDAEKNMLMSWIDTGMARGDAADMPEPKEWETGWRIGEPDMVFDMPQEVTIDPTGVVPYMYQATPAPFDHDVWISAAEVRPGNPQVLHHIIMFVNAPQDDSVKTSPFENGYLLGFAPGAEPLRLLPGQAMRIPAGSDLVWQIHYTPTGKKETDRSQFAIKFAEGPIEERVTVSATMTSAFAIPPGDANYKVASNIVIPRDAYIHEFLPHMHLRGKSFDYYAKFPNGHEQHLLSVPEYDFNWQMTYTLEEPLFVPKGTEILGRAVFDNSEENPYNPDPTKTVVEGDQTWEEMMIGFFTLSYKDENAQRSTTGD